MSRIVIIGGGPAGYEAALVAAQLDADVTVVEADGAGGACVLSDCVPSKTFIASSDVVTGYRDTERVRGATRTAWKRSRSTRAAVHARVKRLALAQSADIHAKLVKAGVDLVAGRARLGEDTLGHTHQVVITPADGDAEYSIDATTVLIATGATPAGAARRAVPDGERILDLAPGLRPARAARAPDRGRLRRHRRRVRQRLPGDGRRRHPGLQPGPGDAARGRRRRHGDRAGVPRPGHDDPRPTPAPPRSGAPATASWSSSPTAGRSTARTR